MKAGIFIGILVLAAQANAAAQTHAPQNDCDRTKLFKAHSVVAWATSSQEPRAFVYRSGMEIDADGGYRTYHPQNKPGLDSLNHAGHPGNWWALVTDNDRKGGHPVVQGPSDPAPGYYVSTTSLYDEQNTNPRDPHRYVDALSIPYVVLPPQGFRFARLGDFAMVTDVRNGRIAPAIVADESARGLPFGEGSIALANALGIDSNPRSGGISIGVVYVVFPGSGNGKPRALQEITANSEQLFARWGGMKKLNACLAAL